jgi:hypothetical protein
MPAGLAGDVVEMLIVGAPDNVGAMLAGLAGDVVEMLVEALVVLGEGLLSAGTGLLAEGWVLAEAVASVVLLPPHPANRKMAAPKAIARTGPVHGPRLAVYLIPVTRTPS